MSADMLDSRGPDHARAVVREIFDATVLEVDPERAVRGSLSLGDDSLAVGESRLPRPDRVHIVAVGKAAVAMTRGALAGLEGIAVTGDVITKDGHVDARLPATIRVHEAGHPIPDERGVRATRQMLSGLVALDNDAVVLALISGGGSALLEAPRPGVSLADLARTTDLLLRAGAPIEDLNAVRAPLSAVKAGGLRAAAPGARWITLILSDVLGNDPRIIASGPTVSGRSDPAQALALIDRYSLHAEVPDTVLEALERGNNERPISRQRDDLISIIGDNARAVEAADNAARRLGLEPTVVWASRQGEAAVLGREFVRIVGDVAADIDVVLGGGEATVTVRGDGRGGRNTEFALAAALELERRGLHQWVVASLGTDGQDALTGYAGAIADHGTCHRARECGIDPAAALARNDSLAVFEVAGGAVKTGPTGTNVNDLYIALRFDGHLDHRG